ncbi:MAG: OmpA family protein [Syntrophus sp. SKADARSKE-3]|nr:OmpA family protein [Syntrophus sp. SKADARSKE-3]
MKRKSFLWVEILVLVASVFLFIGCATQKAIPVITPIDLNPKIASGQLTQKADVFEVLFDSTMSMNDIYKSGTKMGQEKALVSLMSDTIPNIKLISALRAFGQLKLLGPDTSQLLYGPTDFKRADLKQVIDPLSGNGLSPMDTALDGARDDLKSQSGKMAVIAFSDGEDMEQFTPVVAARRLKSAYGDRVCIYTVHIGDNAAGRKMMQQIADAGECGFMFTGDSISSPEGMAVFVEKIFLETMQVKKVERQAQQAAPVVKEEPKPEPVAKKEPSTITLNVEFDTNKANIKPKYYNEIKRVADYMKSNTSVTATIEGHTDNVGKEAANIKLSQRRADSIKAYLVDKFGIDSSRLKAVGYGPKNPIASNKTKEGKQKNRRVTAVFSN